MTVILVWHRMLYDCTHMATVMGVKGLRPGVKATSVNPSCLAITTIHSDEDDCNTMYMYCVDV